MTAVLRQLADEGWPVTPAAIADLSPYIRERIKRFGEYATDGLTIAPAAFDPRLNLPETATTHRPRQASPHEHARQPARRQTRVMRTWLSIRVELIQGGGRTLWPRPGRVFAAARSHTFLQLGDAIDTAFARWDRSHLSLFELADATDIYGPIQWEDPPDRSVFAGATRLSRLNAGEQFLYTFDMGDDWTHLCTVAQQRIDPLEALGIIPAGPLSYWGWGEIPDQYGRRSETDDGETPLPPDPQLTDLPPLRPWWGRP